MPPKASASDVDANKAADIVALCHLIMSCDEFKADNNKLAGPLGIAQGKNVPRKINSIIVPHGFELKSGKIVKADDVNDSVPATPKGKASADDNGDAQTPVSNKKKKSTPKKNGANTPRTPASKKRKVQATAADDNEDDQITGHDGGALVKDENGDAAEAVVDPEDEIDED